MGIIKLGIIKQMELQKLELYKNEGKTRKPLEGVIKKHESHNY